MEKTSKMKEQLQEIEIIATERCIWMQEYNVPYSIQGGRLSIDVSHLSPEKTKELLEFDNRIHAITTNISSVKLQK